MAAVVGRERDGYYEEFAPGRASFAVVNLTPVRRLIQTVNYVRTKEEDLARLRGLGAASATQVPLELLLPAGEHLTLRFRVFFACADGAVVDEVATRLRDGRPYFPLYLGLSDFLARTDSTCRCPHGAEKRRGGCLFYRVRLPYFVGLESGVETHR